MLGTSGIAAGGLIVIATKNNGKVKEFAHAFDKLGISVASLNDYPQFPDIPEDGDTFAANARIKAKAAGDALGVPALADDSGLRVEALDGAPGVYSARYAGIGATDADNNAKLLRELAAAGARGPAAAERTGAAGGDAGAAEDMLAAAQVEARGRMLSAESAPTRAELLPSDGSRLLSRAQFVCALALYDPESGTFVEAEGTVDGIITDRPHGAGGFGYDPLFWLPQLGRGMAELTKEEKGQISHRGAALHRLLHLMSS